MKVGRNDPCPCGSGRKFKRCHGPTPVAAAAFARRDALEEAEDLGSLFPFLRPCGVAIESFLEQPSPGDVEEGVALLDATERGRLVRLYADRYPEAWTSLCREIAEDDAAVALVHGAVRVALAEREQVAARVVKVIDDLDDVTHPLEALALALRPAYVWSVEDAARAADAAAPFAADDEAWLDAVEDAATDLATDEHEQRLTRLASRLGEQLPIVGAPRASRLLSDACEAVRVDADARGSALVALLANYIAYLEYT